MKPLMLTLLKTKVLRNLLCNVKGPWVLVELELNNSEKECLFLRMKSIMDLFI